MEDFYKEDGSLSVLLRNIIRVTGKSHEYSREIPNIQVLSRFTMSCGKILGKDDI